MSFTVMLHNRLTTAAGFTISILGQMVGPMSYFKAARWAKLLLHCYFLCSCLPIIASEGRELIVETKFTFDQSLLETSELLRGGFANAQNSSANAIPLQVSTEQLHSIAPFMKQVAALRKTKTTASDIASALREKLPSGVEDLLFLLKTADFLICPEIVEAALATCADRISKNLSVFMENKACFDQYTSSISLPLYYKIIRQIAENHQEELGWFLSQAQQNSKGELLYEATLEQIMILIALSKAGRQGTFLCSNNRRQIVEQFPPKLQPTVGRYIKQVSADVFLFQFPKDLAPCPDPNQLETAFDINSGHTAFHKAALCGNNNVLLLLMKLGVPVNQPTADKLRLTALHIAAGANHVKTVEMLLDHGADLTITTDHGENALHRAVQNNALDAATLLIKRGISIDQCDSNKATVFHHAAANPSNAPELYRLLRAAGAPLNTFDCHGLTPIMRAVSKNNQGAIDFLMSQNVDLLVKNSEEHWALKAARTGKHQRAVNFLKLKQGLIGLIRDAQGNTASHIAVQHGDSSCIQFYVPFCNFTETNNNGSTVYHIAVERNDVELLTALIDADKLLAKWQEKLKAPRQSSHENRVLGRWQQRSPASQALPLPGICMRDKNGNTPLHCAIITASSEIIGIIAANSAQWEIKDAQGRSAVHLAAFIGREGDVKSFIEAGCWINKVTSTDDWIYANSHDNRPWASYLPDVYYRSPLHYAARNGEVEAIEILVRNGAAIDEKAMDSNTYIPGTSVVLTPLLIAAQSGKHLAVKKLIELGASFNALDKNGETVLFFAETAEVVKTLIAAGVNINVLNLRGETPLFAAARKNNTGVIQALVDAGLSPLVRDAGTPPRVVQLALFATNVLSGFVQAISSAGISPETEAMQDFVAAGISSLVDNENRRPAIFYSLYQGHVEATKLLHEQYACEIEPKWLALVSNDVKSEKRCALIKYLHSRGIDLHAALLNGGRALHKAAIVGDAPSLMFLCNNGAPINSICNEGNTALMYYVNFLLAAKSYSPFEFAKNRMQSIACLRRALESHDLESAIQSLVAGHDAPSKKDVEAIRDAFNKITVIKFLLDKGANINAQNKIGQTALHWAIAKGDIVVAAYLLQLGAQSLRDSEGRIPLHYHYNKMIHYAGLLLDLFIHHNVDYTTPDLQGNTLLHHAEVPDQVALFVNKGKVDVNTANNEGNTPLHCAVQELRFEIVQALIESGAAVNRLNRAGNTPLDMLKKARNDYEQTKRQIRTYLIAQGAVESGSNCSIS